MNSLVPLIVMGALVYYVYQNPNMTTPSVITQLEPVTNYDKSIVKDDKGFTKTILIGKDGKPIYMKDLDMVNPLTNLPAKYLWANDVRGFVDVTIPRKGPSPNLGYPPIRTWSKY
jgi:hypothetical protein